MVSQPLMTIKKGGVEGLGLGLKSGPLHRVHYSGPSSGGGGGYHHHHGYHTGDSDGYHYSSHSDGGGGGGKKKNIAMSALTLLAFLFFLNILQNCIQEQVEYMTEEQIVVVSSRLQHPNAQKRIEDDSSTSNNYETNNENKVNQIQRKMDTVQYKPNSLYNVSVVKINTISKNDRFKP